MHAEPQVCFYLGANSPTGFYSLYDQLIDPARAEDIFILKGGPGCGKSSLMRRVGSAMEERGLAVEYIVCSGDPDSLDAVVIPQLNTALVDGTAPHVVEPQLPGAVDRYVNLGACYNKAELQAIRGALTDCMKDYKGCYSRAYRCLSAAAQIGEDMRAIVDTPAVEAKMVKRARGILSREVKKTGGDPGRSVQRFLSAITWKGPLCNFSTVDTLCKRVYELADTYGLAHGMLTHLACAAMAAGYDIITCPSPMAPDRMEHLLIPGLSLAFVTSTPTLPYNSRPYRRIRLDAMIAQELLRHNKARLRFSRKVSAALVEEAVDSLAQAKSMHDALEALYNPHVDFQQVYQTAEDITQELLARI
jgi:hypothetical protein